MCLYVCVRACVSVCVHTRHTHWWRSKTTLLYVCSSVLLTDRLLIGVNETQQPGGSKGSFVSPSSCCRVVWLPRPRVLVWSWFVVWVHSGFSSSAVETQSALLCHTHTMIELLLAFVSTSSVTQPSSKFLSFLISSANVSDRFLAEKKCRCSIDVEANYNFKILCVICSVLFFVVGSLGLGLEADTLWSGSQGPARARWPLVVIVVGVN